MQQYGQRRFSSSFMLIGIVLLMASLGWGWGPTYGQTAGPTPPPQAGALVVTKEVNVQRAQPGDTVTYTIRVTNVGDTAIANVVVEDVLPQGLEAGNVVASAGIVTTNGQTVSLSLPSLAAGETVVITLQTRIRTDARGRIINVATARGINGFGETIGGGRSQAILSAGEEVGEELPHGGSTGAPVWPLSFGGLMLFGLGAALRWRSRRAS